MSELSTAKANAVSKPDELGVQARTRDRAFSRTNRRKLHPTQPCKITPVRLNDLLIVTADVVRG